MLSGADAFFLYDTLGFPLDLTRLMAREAGLAVDSAGFEAAMGAQRAQARAEQQAARGAGGAALRLDAEQTAELARRGVAPTDDAPKFAMSPTDAAAPSVLRAILLPGGGFAECIT